PLHTHSPHFISGLLVYSSYFFFTPPPTTEIYTLSLHDALPIFHRPTARSRPRARAWRRYRPLGCARRCTSTRRRARASRPGSRRSEEHTSELQSRGHLVCRLLLEKKKTKALYWILCIKHFNRSG